MALSLSVEAFDIILSQLDHIDRTAAESVCRHWRELGRLCPQANETVKSGQLWRETQIDSFAAWLYPRRAQIRRLYYTHYEGQWNNAAATAALSIIAPYVEFLSLDVYKLGRNRRGLPSPINWDWLPTFPQAHSLKLNLHWSANPAIPFSSLFPKLRHLWMKRGDMMDDDAPVDHVVHPDVQFSFSDVLPEALETIQICFPTAFGNEESLACSSTLQSLALHLPPWVDQNLLSDIASSFAHCPKLFATFSELTTVSFTSIFYVPFRVQMDAMAALPALEELRIYHSSLYSDSKELERIHNHKRPFKPLNTLKRLHLIGERFDALVSDRLNDGDEPLFPSLRELVILEHLEEYRYVWSNRLLSKLKKLVISESYVERLADQISGWKRRGCWRFGSLESLGIIEFTRGLTCEKRMISAPYKEAISKLCNECGVQNLAIQPLVDLPEDYRVWPPYLYLVLERMNQSGEIPQDVNIFNSISSIIPNDENMVDYDGFCADNY